MKKWSIVVALVVLATIAAAPSFAAKGGQKGKPGAASLAAASTITLITTATTDGGDAVFGSRVTFAVATDATPNPWVENRCSQGGTLVYADTQGFFDGYFRDGWFTLGPTPMWNSAEGASCAAILFSYDGGKRRDLASTSYSVAPA